MTLQRLADDTLVKSTVDTPIGTLVVVASPAGVRRICFPTLDENAARVLDEIHTDPQSEILADATSQLQEYFSGERTAFDLRLDLVGTEFQRQAWMSLAKVGYGHTATYAQQAASLMRPKAVRAVGSANRMNPVPIVLPCHRIIGSNGSLTGFAGGLDTKRWLLDHEQSVLNRECVKETTCN